MHTEVSPPDTAEALVERARDLAGHTLGELGQQLGLDVPASALRAKGLAGRIVEQLLGATAGTAAAPDFEDLGIELKTIPLDPNGKPQESTFVCSIALNDMATTDWEDSIVWHKLRHVLWVPVEGTPRSGGAPGARPLHDRRIGVAKLWTPNESQVATLRRDWETFAELIGAGQVAHITGHMGEALQVRPKAPNASTRRTAPDTEGAVGFAAPRGFYLRARFTASIFTTQR